MTIKVLNLKDLQKNQDYFLCHDVSFKGTQIFSQGEKINSEHPHSKRLAFDNVSVIVTDTLPITVKDLRMFIIENILTMYQNEIKSYEENIITDKKIINTSKMFFKQILEKLKLDYLILLITNRLVLIKAINLSILSFFLSLKAEIKLKEIEEIILSCLLCNLNLCNNINLQNIGHPDFLFDYKDLKIKTSFSIIKDDNNIPNNTKRIIYYSNQFNSNFYYKNENDKKVIIDITLEIFQISNDILTYDIRNNATFYKNIVTKKYPKLSPILSDIIKKSEEQKQKNMRTKIKTFFLNLFRIY